MRSDCSLVRSPKSITLFNPSTHSPARQNFGASLPDHACIGLIMHNTARPARHKLSALRVSKQLHASAPLCEAAQAFVSFVAGCVLLTALTGLGQIRTVCLLSECIACETNV
eukprot:412361-Pleurochrysis_carterae.AAC.1